MSAVHSRPRSAREQRRPKDRRDRLWWSLWYGNFNPRRRAAVARRDGETRFNWPDWHSSHLLAVAIGIALLSVADALLTMGLLQGGAQEVNPLMAALLYRSVAAFAAFKMLLTGCGIVLMVVLARYRFMRVLPVSWVLYGVLISYAGLIGYELWMKNSLGAGATL